MANGAWRLFETPLGIVRVYTSNCAYEPAEDSFLAIRIASKLIKKINLKPRIILDIGSGTGILGISISQEYGSYVIGVDINPYAVKATRETLGSRGVAIQCNWASCFKGPFDLSIMNPPYLPVHDELRDCPELSLSWGASPDILEGACESIARVSRSLVIVYSSLSGWTPFECLGRFGFKAIVSGGMRFFMEKIYAVGAWRHQGSG